MVNHSLYLYFKVHGYLQDASKLTCEYISAVLGNGKEFFGLSSGLHASSMPVWLPHNLIDQLLLELRENSHDPDYHKVSSRQWKAQTLPWVNFMRQKLRKTPPSRISLKLSETFMHVLGWVYVSSKV